MTFKFDRMKRFSLMKALLALILPLSIGYTLWTVDNKKVPSPLPSLEEKQNPLPMMIKGFDANKYYKEKLISRVKADEFKVNHRKFYIFNIRPFNEVTLTNARIEIHLYPEMLDDDFFSSGKSKLSPDLESMLSPDLKRLGLITRGVINGLIMEVYKNDRLCFVAQAKKVYIDIKRKEATLIDASIRDIASQKLIISQSITWDDKEKMLKIPGAYRALTDTLRARGKGINLNLDFKIGSAL